MHNSNVMPIGLEFIQSKIYLSTIWCSFYFPEKHCENLTFPYSPSANFPYVKVTKENLAAHYSTLPERVRATE